MAEAHIGPLPEGTKNCRVCAEPINKAASKCIHCQSEQSWLRQRIGFSGTVLALIVALISVIAATGPIIIGFFTPKNSDIAISFQGADSRILSVLVTNNGSRAGSFGMASLVLRNKGESSVHFGLHTSSGFGPALVVDPGHGILLNFLHIGDIRDEFKRFVFKDGVRCIIYYSTTDFLGEVSYPDKEIECERVKEFVSTYQGHE